MKTYLARLVARAQSPILPASIATRPSPAATAENPFEQTAPAVPTTPAAGVPLAAPAAPASSAVGRALARALPPTPAAPSPLSPPSAKPMASPHAVPLASPTAQPEPITTSHVSRRAPRATAPVIAPAQKILRPRAEPAIPSDAAAAFREEFSAPPAPAQSSTEKLAPLSRTPPPAPALSSPTTARAPVTDEARLLQAADIFMSRLTRRADPFLAAAENSEAPSSVPAHEFAASRPAPAAPRLQPVAPSSVPPPAPSAPSVVIGRVSVEVVPPAPPVHAASPRVTVHRAASRAQSSAPRSSARFGLGQL